ncbi:hypothetical protein GQ600_24510 [Phytophthora cactorum]|nr:hypothetical protein GQ600_7169 [Phytophthora cactorum]KAF1780899.1 hypothetical protein GQ600_24510 [Phytophthora cactorum]
MSAELERRYEDTKRSLLDLNVLVLMDFNVLTCQLIQPRQQKPHN